MSSEPHYTAPDPALQRLGLHCCQLCGVAMSLHKSSGHCFSLKEMAARLKFWNTTGQWPADDWEEEES